MATTLTAAGKAGTLAAEAIMTAIVQTVIDTASKEIGQKEVGKPNCGPAPKKYLASVGLNEGYPWCMAFVYWVYSNVFKKVDKFLPLPKSGGVLYVWNKIDKKYCVKDPKPGDIFIMNLGHGAGHTGIVLEVKGSKFRAVEGNSNDEGSREGYEVCIPKWRDIKGKSIMGFIRIV